MRRRRGLKAQMRDQNAITRQMKSACTKTFVRVYDRQYEVVAKLRDHEAGLKRSNEVMEEDRSVGCIAIQDGWIYLVKIKDKGTPVNT